MSHIQGYDGSHYHPIRIDSSTHSIQTISYEHHEIHSGSHYYSIMHVDVPADDVLDIRLTTPDSPKHLHFVFEVFTEAEFHLTMYEGCSITTAGTGLTAFNSNRNSSKTTDLTLFDYIVNVDLAAANADTTVGTAILGPVATGSGKTTEGSFGRESEKVLKKYSTYCFRFENQSNAAKYVAWEFEWYEHTDKC